MPSYEAPTTDSSFLLNKWLRVPDLAATSGFEDLSNDFVDTVLASMARFSESVTFPLNMSGDREGCTWRNGEVDVPEGFREAYRQYSEDGWFGTSAPDEYGGQGLPSVLEVAATEYLVASNPAFGMFVGLNRGATALLYNFGSDDQKRLYLPRLATGEWNATMDMTEAGAGSDLGMMRSRAIEQEDGTYRISGTKIFISSGEHDLADNIIHMVLARTPDAPHGSKGISLFIVPKFLPHEDGSDGERNAVFCDSIEEKMGLHGSATCTMRFDGATGFLVGAPHDGLRAMFEMMNATRIFVGVQATGNADISYQNAAAYAKERIQGRTATSALSPDEGEPIVRHPDVRRMLMHCRSFSEGARALCLYTALQLDISERHASAEHREQHSELASFLTPIVKGYLSDAAELSTSTALQCFGGHGYIVESGVEQYFRDVRVSRIYEGTTGIQGMDLLGRKVLNKGGKGLSIFLSRIDDTIERCRAVPDLSEFSTALENCSSDLKSVTNWLAANAVEDPHLVGSSAVYYLTLSGIAAMTFVWAQIALVCSQDSETGSFERQKISTGLFYVTQVSPETGSLVAKIRSCSRAVMALPEDAF